MSYLTYGLLSWLYFVVFWKSFDSLFSSYGQLISITLTCSLVLSMTVASSLSWLYFVVFWKSLDSLFSSFGQLISITLTCSLVLSMTVASILLAFTWVASANNGTSQRAVACSFSYSGFGVTCENHGLTLVLRSKDLRTSKNKIWKALLCLCGYLVCASALQPDRGIPA